jgi:hypothetical protein
MYICVQALLKDRALNDVLNADNSVDTLANGEWGVTRRSQTHTTDESGHRGSSGPPPVRAEMKQESE